MRVRSTAWSDKAQFSHTQHMVEVCPLELLPTIQQNMASGGVAIEWPDVCHCPVNGGPTFEVHKQSEGCMGSEPSHCDEIIVWCNCNPEPPSQAVNTQIASGDHIDGCPFDVCPIGTCHPMCSQVTGDDQGLYCHCPCHG